MTWKTLHPAVLVAAGFVCMLGIQLLQALWLVSVVIIVLILALVAGRKKLGAVIRRLRYILIAVIVLFAWQTPGVLIVPVLGMFSPTYDGLLLALDSTARLLATAAVVAVMLEKLSTAQWVSSLYVLIAPLRIAGVSPERFAVRLRLVLDYVDMRNLDWRKSLDSGFPDETAPVMQQWQVSTLRFGDRALLLAMGLFAAGLIIWW